MPTLRESTIRTAYILSALFSTAIAASALADENVRIWDKYQCASVDFQATKITGKYLEVQYTDRDTCTNQLIASGSGPVPLSAWGGSVSDGRITINFNAADIPGFSYTGRSHTFAVVVTRTPAWFENEVVEKKGGGVNVAKWKTTQIKRKYSTDVTGWSTLFGTPVMGSMTAIGSVINGTW
jgi:hypothetical protein